jgi:predicted RNA binding protein YcfA (HicA-like mRNA interferase family)
LVKKDGWYLVRVKGSHHTFQHPVKKGNITIPHPNNDLPIKTINSILKQAGLKGGL